jgi:hypothetical protein
MDERVRAAEQAWRSTGSVADEAAWIKERVREGSLAADRVALLAYLGHEAAARHLAATGTPPAPPPEDLWMWGVKLEPWGRSAAVRATLAAALPLVLEWGKENAGDDLLPRALEAAWALEDAPSEDRRGAVASLVYAGDASMASLSLQRAAGRVTCGPLTDLRDRLRSEATLLKAKTKAEKAEKSARMAAYFAAGTTYRALVGQTSDPQKPDTAQSVGYALVDAALGWSCREGNFAPALLGRGDSGGDSPAGQKAIAEQGARVRKSVLDALAPWILGTGDPLRAALGS